VKGTERCARATAPHPSACCCLSAFSYHISTFYPRYPVRPGTPCRYPLLACLAAGTSSYSLCRASLSAFLFYAQDRCFTPEFFRAAIFVCWVWVPSSPLLFSLLGAGSTCQPPSRTTANGFSLSLYLHFLRLTDHKAGWVAARGCGTAAGAWRTDCLSRGTIT